MYISETEQERGNERFVEVAIPSPLFKTFTYRAPEGLQPGCRVKASFAGRRTVGVIAKVYESNFIGDFDFEVQPVLEVIDQTPVFNSRLVALAEWLSQYYVHPLGDVFKTMLPATTQKVTKKRVVLTTLGIERREILDDRFGSQLKIFFPNKVLRFSRTTLLRRWEKSGQSEDFVKVLGALKKAKLVELADLKDLRLRPTPVASEVMDAGEIQQEAQRVLTPDQAGVLATIVEEGLNAGVDMAPTPFLLHGVTGSGKTEVYLQLIAHVLRERPGAQIVVLVPEISLTPQMTQVFSRRFPGVVAVVHSALPDGERLKELDRIRRGEAAILIGPRSAVFAPFVDLRLLIVDEEHDASYKQETGLCYNGRDVAIVRGKMESACVVLGSATPALESFWNAKTGRYRLCTLAQRVGNKGLPTVDLVEFAGRLRGQRLGYGGHDFLATADDPIDPTLLFAEPILTALRDVHTAGKQAIVLVPRRGYAYYVLDLMTREPVSCRDCSISLTLHKRDGLLHCHYCGFTTSLDAAQRERPNAQLVAVGTGSQKIEGAIRLAVPGARVERLDSDTAAKAGYLVKTLDAFRNRKVDILVGTQMLAKGHDFPDVALTVVFEIDQLLNMPDLRAGERAFQLLVQASGRAGRADVAGRVLVQSLRADHPVIRACLKHDFAAFAEQELALRRVHGYPPFGRLASVELSGSHLPVLESFANDVGRWLALHARDRGLRILGPTVPGIERIRNRFRRVILIMCSQAGQIQPLIRPLLEKFQRRSADLRLKVDIDPQSLM